MVEEVLKLEAELESRKRQQEWEEQNPLAVGEAFKRGRDAGFEEGWSAASYWLGRFAIQCGDLHRTEPPEPIKLSLEKIAAFLEPHRVER